VKRGNALCFEWKACGEIASKLNTEGLCVESLYTLYSVSSNINFIIILSTYIILIV